MPLPPPSLLEKLFALIHEWAIPLIGGGFLILNEGRKFRNTQKTDAISKVTAAQEKEAQFLIANKAAEIGAYSTSQIENLKSMQAQISGLVLEVKELKAAHNEEIKEIKSAQSQEMRGLREQLAQLNKDFDAQQKERREYEKQADRNQALAERYQALIEANKEEIRDLNAKITLVCNEKTEANQNHEEVLLRQVDEIAALQQTILTLNCENEILRDQLKQYMPIGGTEKTK